MVLLQLAWLGVPGHRYRVSGEGPGNSGVTKGSKVRAKVHADAGRALRVVWRGTQVPQPFLLQAARVATSLGGVVVAGGRGVAAGHLLEGA